MKFGDKDYRLRGQGGCLVLDYDVIFDESATLSDYEADETCEQCVKRTNPPVDCTRDSEGNCTGCTVGEYPPYHGYPGEESTPPHGVLWVSESVLCSRLVVFRNAQIVNGQFVYEDLKVFRSRRRGGLPWFDETDQDNDETSSDKTIYCYNPPKCNEGNKRTCCDCTREVQNSQGQTITITLSRSTPGPYRDCEQGPTRPCNGPPNDWGVPSEYGGPCMICSDFAVQRMEAIKHMVTPCAVSVKRYRIINTGNGNTEKEFINERRHHFMGYEQIGSDWWFFDRGEFQDLKHRIAQDDPLGKRKHYVFAHFQMSAYGIECCKGHRPSMPPSGTSWPCPPTSPPWPNPPWPWYGQDNTWVGCHNKIGRHCCSCCKDYQFLKDPEERQQKVKITAAVGFTLECGSLNIRDICDKWWADNDQ